MVVSPPTDSLRRRRAPRGSGDLLRDEILDAATQLLLDTGHAKAVSIRSVAERVGVTPPSIYLHFQDKDALLDAVCARGPVRRRHFALVGSAARERIDFGLRVVPVFGDRLRFRAA